MRLSGVSSAKWLQTVQGVSRKPGRDEDALLNSRLISQDGSGWCRDDSMKDPANKIARPPVGSVMRERILSLVLSLSKQERAPAPIKVSLAGGWMNEAGEVEGALRCCERPARANTRILEAIAGAVATTSGLPLFRFCARFKVRSRLRRGPDALSKCRRSTKRCLPGKGSVAQITGRAKLAAGGGHPKSARSRRNCAHDCGDVPGAFVDDVVQFEKRTQPYQLQPRHPGKIGQLLRE